MNYAKILVNIDKDICYKIAEYVIDKYRYMSWVSDEPELLNITVLENPGAFYLIDRVLSNPMNRTKEAFKCLSRNKNINIINVFVKSYLNNIELIDLCKNENCFHLVSRKINHQYNLLNDDHWIELWSNPSAGDFLLNHVGIYCTLGDLSRNSNPRVVQKLIENENEIQWCQWNENPNNTAIRFLFEHHPDKIYLTYLKNNTSSIAFDYIRQHTNDSRYFNVNNVSHHPYVQDNNEEICFDNFSNQEMWANPHLFSLLKEVYHNIHNNILDMTLDDIQNEDMENHQYNVIPFRRCMLDIKAWLMKNPAIMEVNENMTKMAYRNFIDRFLFSYERKRKREES